MAAGNSSSIRILVLCSCALGTYWAWNYAFIAASVIPSTWMTNVSCHGIGLALSLVLSKRLAPFGRFRILNILSPVMVSAGTALFYLSSTLFPELHLQWISSAIVGFFSAGLLILWSEAFDRLSLAREQEKVTHFAIVVGFSLFILTNMLPEFPRIVANTVLPVASGLCTIGVLSAPQDAFSAAKTRGRFPRFRAVLPVRLLVCSFVFAIPIGWFKNGFEGNWIIVQTIALLLVVVAVIPETAFKKKSSTSLFPKMFVLMLSGGLLLLPLYTQGEAVSGAFIVSGSFIFRAYLYQICGIVSSQTKTPPSSTVALATCMIDLGWIGGMALRAFTYGTTQSLAANATIGVAYIIFVSGLLFISKKYDYFAVIPDQNSTASSSSASDIKKKADYLALEFALTQREREIAEMIARGMTLTQIATEMTLSHNTVKTHARHVYEKCGVHSKSELAELLRAIDI